TQIIEGSSIGGGRILISRVNGIEAKITAEAPTLLITQKDIKGMVSEISHILSEENLNIGIMRVNRASKGGTATTIIETDSPIPLSVPRKLCAVRGILSVQIIELK
ncbi:MAG: L-serine ammonia-lyase, iron-sulfur-dependent, subunit beta, partial [Angelakisella sp.]